MVDERVAELARLMQGAALDAANWEPALNAVNAFVGASGVVLLSVEARRRFAPHSTDLSELMEDYFSNGWYAHDKREACIPLLKAKGVVFDHEFQSVENIVEGDYYHDFLARHRRKWFAGVGVEIDGDDWCLALQRSPEIGPFDRGDLKTLGLVRGLLGNAAHLSRALGRSWIAGLRHALDVMGQAAMVFDHHARVLEMNAAAAALFGSSVDRERTLTFRSLQATDGFAAMLKNALSLPGSISDQGLDTTLHLETGSYHCRATSLLGHEGLIATSAAALVVVKPLARDPAAILKKMYGLTDAETKVAVAVANGQTVGEVAIANRVSVGTVRTQIKSVFSKTDINKQSKLVAFVRNLTAGDISQ